MKNKSSKKNKKSVLVVCRATYRGIQILESAGVFILYIGVDRHEFTELPLATGFIDEWHKLKEN